MRLSASDYYTYYRSSECDLRVHLRHKGKQEAPPGPCEIVSRRLAERHERGHLAIFPDVLDLSAIAWQDRERRTREAVKNGAPVIYQELENNRIARWVGMRGGGEARFPYQNPRFNSKISRTITEKDHPEILRQLQLYGWLFEQSFGQLPLRLEVQHSGRKCGDGASPENFAVQTVEV